MMLVWAWRDTRNSRTAGGGMQMVWQWFQFRPGVFAAALLVAMPSPAQPPPQPQTAQAPAPAEAKPGQTAAAPVDPKTYIVGAEDVLMVRVWREPDMSGPVVVRPDGRVTLPLVGDVQASGLTPEQFRERVVAALSAILNKPEVIVSVQEVRSKKYYVSGEVGRSGPVPLVTPTTVLQALSLAGFREWAKKGKIVIMRGTQRFKFNYNDVIKGKKLEQNILLQDGDHIYVP
jgi:polysaccharide export outer membrane protein